MVRKVSRWTRRAFVTLLAVLVLISFAYHPQAKIADGFQGKFIDIDGNPIRVRQAGLGPDLLLVHGCPGSVEDWDAIFDQLATRYRVTAYDRPGHGFSGMKGSRFNLHDNAEVARKLISQLGLKDVLIVGHSYGSSIGLTLAVQHTPNIHGYVLIASPGYKPVDLDAIIRLTGVPVLGKGLCVALAPLLSRDLILSGLKRGFRPNIDLITEKIVDERLRIWGKPSIGYVRARELVQLEKELEKNSANYASIQERVMLIQGRNDTTTRAAWKLHRDIPHSTLIEFDNVGHYTQFVKPKEVIDVIDHAIQTAVQEDL